jgi:hypothetical protein
MIVKKGKQMKLELFDNYKIIFGTVDNKNPKSMYLTISGWGELINETEVNYSLIIKKINKDIKRKLYETLNKNLFDVNRSIIDFDIKESGLSRDKKSYMNCELTLFKLNDFKIQNSVIKEEINNILIAIISDILENNQYFIFHKNKN